MGGEGRASKHRENEREREKASKGSGSWKLHQPNRICHTAKTLIHAMDPRCPLYRMGKKKKNQPAKTPVVNSPVKAKISHQVKETVAKIREAVNLQNKEMYRKQTI